MKKTLVAAVTLALGLSASAYAANPFSDVPAGHWAYDSIAKLAEAGVIDGYGDGSFRGGQLMTRYEMAQIVARAMAQGANVDKLAAEFADELDALGVRVAALEKQGDNVKITGYVRAEYGDRRGRLAGEKGHVGVSRLRTRIFVNGRINDDWNYTARIQNDQKFNNFTGDETTKFNEAYVTGKLGGVQVVAGKTDWYLANGMLYDDVAEVLSLTYGKEVKVNAYYGKPTGYGYREMFGGSLSGKLGNLSLSLGYDKYHDAVASGNEMIGDTGAGAQAAKDGADNGVFNVSAAYKFGDLTLSGTYLHSDLEDKDLMNPAYAGASSDGYVIGLSFKGAKAAKPGSWGLWANYYNQGVGTTLAHTMYTGDWGYFVQQGFEGFGVGGEVTLAKNMVAKVHYYDLEGKEDDLDSRVVWSRLQINF